MPFPAGVVRFMRNPPSCILLFGVWIWEGEKRLFISNTLIPLIPVGSWLGFPPAERGCEWLPSLFVQKYQRAAAPATGCGVGTPHLRALTLLWVPTQRAMLCPFRWRWPLELLRSFSTGQRCPQVCPYGMDRLGLALVHSHTGTPPEP